MISKYNYISAKDIDASSIYNIYDNFYPIERSITQNNFIYPKDIQNLINGVNNANIMPIAWTATSQSFATYTITSVCYGNGKFVAVGGKGQIGYSIDGINWAAAQSFTTDNINSVCYGNGKFVAVGYGTVGYSTDGINWTKASQSVFTQNTMAVGYGNGKFIAGGYNPTMGYSTDGINWTAISQSAFTNAFTNVIDSICYGNGKFVACGYPGKTGYSTDGINWTAASDSFTDALNTVCYGNGKFVIGGSSGQMGYSTDGTSWTAISQSIFNTDTDINSICYGNGKFVAVSREDNYASKPYEDYGKIAYSTDGINWTAVSKCYTTKGIHSVCYGNGKFVACGHSKEMGYSQTGLSS